MRLQAEKEVEDSLKRPKRQMVESLRYSEALRHKLLDEMAARGGQITYFCPCVPPRSVADNRLHLCAHNCPLRDNWKMYNRLVSDCKSMFGIPD